jgi:hypothetical protein
MAIDIPDSPSVNDLLAVGNSKDIRFLKYAGSSIWNKSASRVFIFDGQTPSNTTTAVLDGGTV